MIALLGHQPPRKRFEQRIDVEVRHPIRDPWRIEQQVRARDLGSRAVERELSRQHLVDDDPEREQVDPVIDRICDGLFGSHVMRRAEDQPVRRQASGRGRRIAALAQDRDPEIDDPRDLVAVRIALDDHVLGLEVTMNEAVLVCVIQPLEHLPHDVDDPGRRHRCFAQ